MYNNNRPGADQNIQLLGRRYFFFFGAWNVARLG